MLIILVCYCYKEILLFLIIRPYSFLDNNSFYFIYTGITEVFSVYLEVIYFFSFQFLVFYIFYNVFTFLIPALFLSEYYYLRFIFFFLILITVCLTYISIKIWIPFAWNFFISFSTFTITKSFYFESKLFEYFQFFMSTYNFCLFTGQFFFILFVFFKDLFLKSKYVMKYRKLYYYLFILIATIISPPEIYCQIVKKIWLFYFAPGLGNRNANHGAHYGK